MQELRIGDKRMFIKPIEYYVQMEKKKLAKKIATLEKPLHMAIVQVGHVPASDKYVKNKIKDCKEVGIQCDLINLEEKVKEEELLNVMNDLNNSNDINGYIVQLPLPKEIDEETIKLAINPNKDIDGFHPLAKTTPATPLGIINYLMNMSFHFKGKNAVVIGRSDIVGKPMAKILLEFDMNVTVLHSKTPKEELARFVENADLIVVATGHRHTLTNEFKFKPSAFVMDVGINVENGKLYGDCDEDLKVAYKSPVPKGCGLLTRLSLVDNLLFLSNQF